MTSTRTRQMSISYERSSKLDFKNKNLKAIVQNRNSEDLITLKFKANLSPPRILQS